jgi:putative heme iron utilization protein
MSDAEAHKTSSEGRRLLRVHRYGVLCTLSKRFDGHPFGSIVPYLTDHDGSLVIFISGLAEHTKNIRHDPRVSLITHSQDNTSIQEQGRATLMGRAHRMTGDREHDGRRYLRYFPAMRQYLALQDFSFYRIAPFAIRYIGGFGDARWVAEEGCRLAPYSLMEQEDSLLAAVNSGHAQAMRHYCRKTHHVETAEVEMIGMDCDGCDINADGKILRLDFAHFVKDEEAALAEIAQLMDC